MPNDDKLFQLEGEREESPSSPGKEHTRKLAAPTTGKITLEIGH